MDDILCMFSTLGYEYDFREDYVYTYNILGHTFKYDVVFRTLDVYYGRPTPRYRVSGLYGEDLTDVSLECLILELD